MKNYKTVFYFVKFNLKSKVKSRKVYTKVDFRTINVGSPWWVQTLAGVCAQIGMNKMTSGVVVLSRFIRISIYLFFYFIICFLK